MAIDRWDAVSLGLFVFIGRNGAWSQRFVLRITGWITGMGDRNNVVADNHGAWGNGYTRWSSMPAPEQPRWFSNHCNHPKPENPESDEGGGASAG